MRAGDRVGPDPDVVTAARAGDERALDALVAQCLPLVYNIVGRALDGNDDVDDVVQETLLRVVRGLGDLREPTAFRSWLVAIAVRQVRDREQARKAAWHQRTGLDAAELIPDPASDFASVTILRLGLTDQRREIAEATRWLDPGDRTLLALWWLEETGDIGRTELAEALGLTRQHAAVKVQRMKEQLETSRTVVRALGAADDCGELRALAGGWDGIPSPLWRKRFARHIRGCAVCGRTAGVLLPMDRLLSGLPLLPVPFALGGLPPAPGHVPGPVPGNHPAPGHHPVPDGHPGPGHMPHPAPGGHSPTPGHLPGSSAPGAQPAPGGHVPLPDHVPVSSAPGTQPASGGQPTVPRGPRRPGAHRGAHRLGSRLLHGPLAVPAAAVTAVAAVAASALVAVHVSDGKDAPAAHAAPATTTASPAAATPTTPVPTTTSPTPTPTKTHPAASKKPATHAPVKAPPPPAPPASSSRKGVGVWSFDGVNTALAESGASWYYTWSTTHSGISGPGFVPMIWGSGSVTSAALAQARQAGPYLLGFNEPDMGGQANMTVDQALSLWPKLESAGKVLGSPAVAYGGDTPGGWLDRFMTGAKQKGYRVDFIALHWYGGDFTTSDAVAQLRSYLEAVHNRYGKPIWLTEFALTDFSTGTARYPSDAQQAAFLTAATKMLDGLPYVQRYAWFGLPAKDGAPSTGLFHSGPVATEEGRAFERAR